MLVTVCPECKKVNTFQVTTRVNFESDLHMRADGHIMLEDVDERVVEKILYCCDCGYEEDGFVNNKAMEEFMKQSNMIQDVEG
jgi:hypothetical protein